MIIYTKTESPSFFQIAAGQISVVRVAEDQPVIPQTVKTYTVVIHAHDRSFEAFATKDHELAARVMRAIGNAIDDGTEVLDLTGYKERAV